MYEPISYWKEAGKTYFQDFRYTDEFIQQEKVLVDYLKTIEFKTVLELGCGFGRITRLIDQYFYKQLDNYIGVDISRDQLNHAANYAYKQRPKIFVESDIESLGIDGKFDLVIAVEVLMHQRPEKMQSIIDKMKSLSNKHVINIDYYHNDEGLAPYNFNHNYPKYYGEVYGCKEIGKQMLFHYQT